MDIQEIIEKLNRNKNKIPIDAAHKEIANHRLNQLSVLDESHIRFAAVMLLLFPFESHIATVLIHRNKYKGVHSDQISFPGGQVERNDPDDFHAALRETREELGIRPDSIQRILQLGTIYIPVSNFQVAPFVGYMNRVPQIIKDPKEVTDYFFTPVEELLTKDAIKHREVRASQNITINVPCFELNGNIVWGATAMILNEFRYLLSS